MLPRTRACTYYWRLYLKQKERTRSTCVLFSRISIWCLLATIIVFILMAFNAAQHLYIVVFLMMVDAGWEQWGQIDSTVTELESLHLFCSTKKSNFSERTRVICLSKHQGAKSESFLKVERIWFEEITVPQLHDSRQPISDLGYGSASGLDPRFATNP